ncbi:MAG TPA: glycosyltransferase family 9 protein [Ktedonobacteraceae bacterium]|nr:glycosyltransferase family 9 protein [Ktedonobacteraceae bacterium]
MNIVVIRQGAIGDSLLSFPVLSALRARYTNPHVTFIGNPNTLQLAKTWGIAEDVFNYEDRLWDEVFSSEGIQSANLRELFQQTDLVICWATDRGNVVKPNLLRAGVKEVIIGPWCATVDATKHMVEYLAEPLGLEVNATEYVVPSTGWSNGFLPYNPPIAIQPGSSAAARCWPSASFAAVINKLLRLNYPVLLIAGPSEDRILKEMRKHLSRPPKAEMLSVLQNAPLLEVAQRLQPCRYYLGNDSGIGHLAGMLGVPTLILFGPTFSIAMPPVAMHPVGPRVEVIQEKSLSRLSPDRVIKHMLRRLS